MNAENAAPLTEQATELKKSRHGRVIKPSSKLLEAEGVVDDELAPKRSKKSRKKELDTEIQPPNEGEMKTEEEGEISTEPKKKTKHKKERKIKPNRKLLLPMLQDKRVTCAGSPPKFGLIKEGFIACECCSLPFSPADFEFHAIGAHTYNPLLSIIIVEDSINIVEYCKLKEETETSDASKDNITAISKRRRKHEPTTESFDDTSLNVEKSPKSLSSRRKRKEKIESQELDKANTTNSNEAPTTIITQLVPEEPAVHEPTLKPEEKNLESVQ